MTALWDPLTREQMGALQLGAYSLTVSSQGFYLATEVGTEKSGVGNSARLAIEAIE